MQRLRARNSRPHEPLLQPRRGRYSVCREPAPCRFAARHRSGHGQHGGSSPADVCRNARTEARGRSRRLRYVRRSLWGELRGPWWRCKGHSGRRHRPGLSAHAPRNSPWHPGGDSPIYSQRRDCGAQAMSPVRTQTKASKRCSASSGTSTKRTPSNPSFGWVQATTPQSSRQSPPSATWSWSRRPTEYVRGLVMLRPHREKSRVCVSSDASGVSAMRTSS